MDSSKGLKRCRAKVKGVNNPASTAQWSTNRFAKQKLNPLAHNWLTVYTQIHTLSIATGMVCLGLWKCLSTKEILQLGFEPWQSLELLQTDRQRIPDRGSEEFERALTNRFQILRFGIFKSFSLERRRVREVWHVQNGVSNCRDV